ncbi:hypothetical protein [Bacillus sp. PS06]|uniref:hypothetical protein n=1 Tax=Bacillus sp. PS06 TaxID=2764176 RepID=UPI00177AC6A6|nr:hypothetical protein [Bacillus sp. PS06]MBD8069080.1 hypothetical protein [Bacillus sp. PS06]
MKKYWKSIAIIVVIIFSLGAFYVNAASSVVIHPAFVIETLSGDANEIKPLQLVGHYSDTSSMNYVSTSVTLDEEGSTYQNRSFLNNLIGHPPGLISEYRDNYRNFMRGKNFDINSYFENDKHLAYADVEYNLSSIKSRDFKFNLAVLTKADGNIDSFQLEVPNGNKFDYMYVEDVQLIENKLFIITHSYKYQGDNYVNEKHNYTIDVTTHKMENDDIIIQGTTDGAKTRTDTQLVSSNPIGASEHLIFIETEWEIIEDMESSREEVIKQEFISYNILTKEKETIDLPNLQLDENNLSFFDGSTIYFMTFGNQELIVTPYHLEDDKAGDSYSIPLSGEDGMAYAHMTTVKNDKLYITSSQMTNDIEADVIVADATTGETLFTGKIAFKDPAEFTNPFELYFYSMYVK